MRLRSGSKSNVAVDVKPLTQCDDCGANIWTENVFKKVAIPESVGHIAIVYRCPECEAVGKAAMALETWRVVKEAASERSRANERLVNGFIVDLDADWSVDQLKSLWASLPNPPKIERGKNERKNK